MSLQNFFSYIVVYFLLLFKAGFFFVETIGRYTNLILLAISIILFIISKSRFINSTIWFAFLTLFCEIITFATMGFPGIEFVLSCTFNVLLVVFIVSAIGKEQFKFIFSNINLVICVISLICFILHYIGLPLYQKFPLLFNSHGEGGYFVILSIPRIEFSEWSNYRIQGIYWEPGAFQFFIVISAIFDLFNKNFSGKVKLFRLIVFSVTVLLTFSTTGIIGGLLVVFLYAFKARKRSIIPLVMFLFFLMIAISYKIIDENSYLYYSLFGKLNGIKDSYMYGGSSDVSAETRFNSFVYVLDEYLKSPLVGIGQMGRLELLRRRSVMTTFTPLNMFAFYGTFLGVIHVVGITRFMNLRGKSFLEIIIVIVILILSVASEQFAFNPILMCISAYGYVSRIKYQNNKIPNHIV